MGVSLIRWLLKFFFFLRGALLTASASHHPVEEADTGGALGWERTVWPVPSPMCPCGSSTGKRQNDEGSHGSGQDPCWQPGEAP